MQTSSISVCEVCVNVAVALVSVFVTVGIMSMQDNGDVKVADNAYLLQALMG